MASQHDLSNVTIQELLSELCHELQAEVAFLRYKARAFKVADDRNNDHHYASCLRRAAHIESLQIASYKRLKAVLMLRRRGF